MKLVKILLLNIIHSNIHAKLAKKLWTGIFCWILHQKIQEHQYFAEYFSAKFTWKWGSIRRNQLDAGQRLYAHVDETPLLDVLPSKEILWIPRMFHQRHINLSGKYSAKYSCSQVFVNLAQIFLRIIQQIIYWWKSCQLAKVSPTSWRWQLFDTAVI